MKMEYDVDILKMWSLRFQVWLGIYFDSSNEEIFPASLHFWNTYFLDIRVPRWLWKYIEKVYTYIYLHLHLLIDNAFASSQYKFKKKIVNYVQ